MQKQLKYFLDDWILIKFSNRLKFSIKVSLSLMLAYMIPISMGWNQPNTSAMTVMIIASAGGVSNSISKGFIRVIGTIIGAILGMILIAMFPQDRAIYLISMSIIVSILIYLYYAYQGDSTVFMLSAMMIMMIFLNGSENAFLYGIDRTYMTIFGIVVYSFIGFFLWPVKEKRDTINDAPKGKMFIWLDPEYLKATIQLFFVFWFAVAFWIYLNPPSGFLVVMLATLLGLLTTFSPLKPGILIILFTIGFIFSTLMYVFVLPNLVYGWELALFIFFYTFIAFYIINKKLTIFFLLGLFLLGIDNSMSYNFDVFLMILLTFYIFLIILMFFYNFPFSSKPQDLFIILKRRFFAHAEAIVILETQPKNWINLKKLSYHKTHLAISSKKLTLWGSKIDMSYFNNILKEQIELFSGECEKYIQNSTPLKECYNASKKINWKSLNENKF